MLALRGGCRPLQPTRPTPSWHRRQAIAPAGFGLLPVRSPLLRESSLFLGVLRCFSSPGALPGSLLGARPCAGRVAPFGHPRIAGCQRLPGAFRRVAASFLGRQRQGIHHAPIMRISCCTSPSGMRVTTPADRHAPAGWSRLAAPPAPSATTAPGGPRVCVLVWLCMLLCSARGRADTSPVRRTGTGATSGSGHVMPRQGQTASRGRRTPRVPRGALSKCRTQTSSDLSVVRPWWSSRSSNLVRSRLPTSDELSQPLACWHIGMLAQRWHRPLRPAPRALPGRWSRGDSNPGPPPCKGGALPAKLRPPTRSGRVPPPSVRPGRSARTGWARLDSNQGPRPYQGRALTT